jgi:branched-subunit amino acid transport protein
MNLWWVLILGGVLTFLTRLSFIYLLGRVKTPTVIQRALRFVPPAVLSAIIAPEVLMTNGALNLSFGNLRLFAALAATLVAWYTKNALMAIISGMLILWALQALF